MISKNEIILFQKLLKKGIPAGEITEDMRQKGYTEEDIKLVFAPKPYDMRGWYLGFAVLFAIMGISLFLKQKDWLFLLFSGLMFLAWHGEGLRLNKRKADDTDA